MRPRKILTGGEVTEILDHAVREGALAAISLQMETGWSTIKSRFLERDPQRRFFVLDYQSMNGDPLPLVVVGQCVGVSFRHKSRKIMLASVVEAKGKYRVDTEQTIPALRFRWPQQMTEMQRRAYYRTPVPTAEPLTVSLWSRGDTDAQPITGAALDISCGGSLVRLNQFDVPPWEMDDTLVVSIALDDGRPPLKVEAYFRGTRHDGDGALCAAIQFVGLEMAPDGRSTLQRLARTIQKFNRLNMGEELRAARSRSQF